MGGYRGAIRNAGVMDDAAVCVVAASPMAECAPLIKDKLCTIFCCCKKHPILKTTSAGQEMRYMQLCADAMLIASNANKAGVLNSVPYDMGKTPPEPIARPNYKARTAQIYKSEESDVDTYGSARIFLVGKVRIPDVVVLKDPTRPPIQDNIKKIYDFKFPGDRWRGTQKEDYQKIQGANGPRVEALNRENCTCAKREDDDSENMDAQAMADAKASANEALEKLFADIPGQSGLMGDVRAELERQALHNTTSPSFHTLYGVAVVTAVTGGVGAAVLGGASAATVGGTGAVTVGGAAVRATVTQFVPRAGQVAKTVTELPKAAGVIPWLMPEMDK